MDSVTLHLPTEEGADRTTELREALADAELEMASLARAVASLRPGQLPAAKPQARAVVELRKVAGAAAAARKYLHNSREEPGGQPPAVPELLRVLLDVHAALAYEQMGQPLARAEVQARLARGDDMIRRCNQNA